MRVSEKTVELNFCANLPKLLGRELFWFGLTQKQEARAGFDACARLGSDLLLFQLKASNRLMANGARRFVAEHNQMKALRNRVKTGRRVFYVLPDYGSTSEICGSGCFASCASYLDVATIPNPVPQPIATGSSPRRIRSTNCHYIDVHIGRPFAIIHSEPFQAKLLRAEQLSELVRGEQRDLRAFPMPETSPDGEKEFEEFWRGINGVDRSTMVAGFAA